MNKFNEAKRILKMEAQLSKERLEEEIIKEALNEAYEKARDNAYFGNGFEAGVEFAKEHYGARSTNWISVEERLPEEYTWVNCSDGKTTFMSRLQDNKEWVKDRKVTHWQPLPTPPNKEEE